MTQIEAIEQIGFDEPIKIEIGEAQDSPPEEVNPKEVSIKAAQVPERPHFYPSVQAELRQRAQRAAELARLDAQSKAQAVKRDTPHQDIQDNHTFFPCSKEIADAFDYGRFPFIERNCFEWAKNHNEPFDRLPVWSDFTPHQLYCYWLRFHYVNGCNNDTTQSHHKMGFRTDEEQEFSKIIEDLLTRHSWAAIFRICQFSLLNHKSKWSDGTCGDWFSRQLTIADWSAQYRLYEEAYQYLTDLALVIGDSSHPMYDVAKRRLSAKKEAAELKRRIAILNKIEVECAKLEIQNSFDLP